MGRAGTRGFFRFTTMRVGARLLSTAAPLLVCSLAARNGFADATWDPSLERMAVTDRSALADIQPRIWMLANGGPGYPGRLLVSRRPDVNQNGWFYTALSGLDMGLDAVSGPEGSTQRQRDFYVMNDGI